MRYSFLDLLACPYTKEPFVLVGAQEDHRPIPVAYVEKTARVSQPDAIVGPMPADGVADTETSKLLASVASAPGDPARNEAVIVREGLLVACNSGRWYPIVDEIPQVLPDSLRDWDADIAFFRERIAPRLPPALAERLMQAHGSADRKPKPGDNYKSSEMSILDKIDDPEAFLGPGYLSPFNPGWLGHSADLIRGFAVCLSFMKLTQGCRVLDAGCGYSWTTEWMMKMGLRPVGLEVSRVYLDVGRKRMGPNNQPHLVVGDTENLPFQDGSFQTVLGFDAFHHIPNRAVAMRQFNRALKPGGRIVLVEPGEIQETTPAAIEAMRRFGTMEVGMELKDVQAYIDGIDEFDVAKETFLTAFTSDDGRPSVAAADLKKRDFIGWGLYTVDKREVGFQRIMSGARDAAKAILGR